MKKTIASIICVAMLLSVLPYQGILAADNVIELYVAPNGDDSALGTLDAPLATLQGAKDRVSKIKKDGTAVNIYFRGGEYRFSDSVMFYKTDSGSENAPITYMAYMDEEPVFTGAVDIKTEDFTRVTGEMYERLPKSSRDYVGVVDLKKKGLTSFTPFTAETAIARSSNQSSAAKLVDTYIEFYFNDRAMTLAEWPNGDDNYAKVEKIKTNTQFGGGTEGRMKNWVKAENAMIKGYVGLHDYGPTTTKIMGYDVKEDLMIFAEGDYSPGYYANPTAKHLLGVAPAIGGKWFIQNLIEELDFPGEYYVDYDRMKLYFYPPYSTVGVDMKLAVNEKPMVKMDNTEYVTFRGITFEKNRDNVIELTTTDHIQFLGCTIQQFALRGIVTKHSAHNTLIDGCDFFMAGNCAISINDRSFQVLDTQNYDHVNLIQQNNIINNCHFWDLQNQFCSTCASGAISIYEVGNVVSNNRIHDSKGNIVYWTGNDHTLRNNESYAIMKFIFDQGAFYSGRSRTQYGIEINNNHFHDFKSTAAKAGEAGHAIYFDDTHGGGNVHHNIFNNLQSTFWLRNGTDMKFVNNIIAHDEALSFLNALGYTEKKTYSDFSQAQLPLVFSLESFEKYPKNMERTFFGDQWPNYGGVYKNNLFYRLDIMPNIAQGAIDVGMSNDNNWFYEGNEYELFNDPDNDDYTINPKYKLPEEYESLRNIKLDEIGIYESENRKNVNTPLSEFKLFYPYNFTDEVAGDDVILKWEDSIGADAYIVELSFDENFERVIDSYEVLSSYIVINNLDNDESEYFWRVKAVAFGKDCKEIKLNSGGPRRFKTRGYDILDKTLLESSLKKAEELLPLFTEGVEAGNVAYGSTDNLKTYINSAKEMLKTSKGVQTDIDALSVILDNEIMKIGETVVREYTGIDSIIEKKDAWITKNLNGGGLSHIDGGVTFGNTDNQVMTVYTNTFAPIERNKMFCFKVKIDIPDAASGGKWQAIGFQRKEDAGIRLYDGTDFGYLFLIKNTTIEVQLWNGKKQRILASVPNTLPKGEYADVKFGVLDFGVGQSIILEVNGETVFKHAELVDLIRDDLYLSIYDSAVVEGDINTNPMGIKVALPEEIPQNDIQLGNRLSVGENDVASAIREMSGSTEMSVVNDVKVYKEKFDNLKSLDFSIKPKLSDKEQGIIFRLSDAQFNEINSDYYKLSFKNGKLILKKNKGSKTQIMSIKKTDEIKSDEWNKVSVYTVFENGGTRIRVYVDGKQLINCLDLLPIKSNGYFGVYNNSSSEMLIKP